MPVGLLIWPENPGVSLLVWAIFLVSVMYGARSPAHRAIQGIARAVAQGCRLSARAIAGLQARMTSRNREVLLSAGLNDTERQIEQEFRRISDIVDRDLASYPALHKQLADQVASIDEDYRRSTYEAPAPQGWTSSLKAAEELADLPNSQHAATKAIGALKEGLMEAHNQALTSYRKATQERHRLLSRMVPTWRRMDGTLTRMDQAVKGIFERSRHIDDLMERYKEIAAGSGRAERLLTASAVTQFGIAGLVLCIALLGGFINFQLIALPMSEMVGATSRLGNMQTSDVAALVIIMVEISMGLFLMESLRITRLFPVIGALDDRLRRKMGWVIFGILFVLAGIESSLAYMRDLLAADRAALTQALAGATVERPEFMWIPAVGQMVMGFILPFALAFVAIPLESFVHAARTVGGHIVVGVMRVASFMMRLAGLGARTVGNALVNIYDMAIFFPLKIEELFVSPKSGSSVELLEARRTASRA